jgi:hypothetical protein
MILSGLQKIYDKLPPPPPHECKWEFVNFEQPLSRDITGHQQNVLPGCGRWYKDILKKIILKYWLVLHM